MDDKKVTTLVNGPTTDGVLSLYPSYVGRDLYFVMKKKNICPLACMHACVCMWSVLSFALYLPFLSLVVSRLKVRVSLSPLSWTLCVQGILIRLRRLSQEDRSFAGLAHATYIDGEHHWMVFKLHKTLLFFFLLIYENYIICISRKICYLII